MTVSSANNVGLLDRSISKKLKEAPTSYFYFSLFSLRSKTRGRRPCIALVNVFVGKVIPRNSVCAEVA